MNKYNLIEKFFKNYEDAVKFVVSLKQCGIANDDGNCIAILQKDNDTKWTFILEWKGAEFVGEEIEPFRPTKENIDQFNKGCKRLAEGLEIFIDTGEQERVTKYINQHQFGDLIFKKQ